MRYGVKPFLYEISSTILNVSNNGFYRYLKQDFVPLSRVSLYESNVVIDVINTYKVYCTISFYDHQKSISLKNCINHLLF